MGWWFLAVKTNYLNADIKYDGNKKERKKKTKAVEEAWGDFTIPRGEGTSQYRQSAGQGWGHVKDNRCWTTFCENGQLCRTVSIKYNGRLTDMISVIWRWQANKMNVHHLAKLWWTAFLLVSQHFYWTVSLYQVGRRRVNLVIPEKNLKRGSRDGIWRILKGESIVSKKKGQLLEQLSV